MHEMPWHLTRPALDVACYLLCRRRVDCSSSMVHTVLGPGVRHNLHGDLYEVVWLVSVQNGFYPPKEGGRQGGFASVLAFCEMKTQQCQREGQIDNQWHGLGRPIRMFNRSKALVKKSKALAKKKKQAQDFLSNPKNLKLFQQVSPSQLQD